MGRRIVAAVSHVLAGSKLQHLHEAQRHAPLQKELLVERGVAAAAPAAVVTPGQGRKRRGSGFMSHKLGRPPRDKDSFFPVIRNRTGQPLLPNVGRRTHENIVEQEEASLLGFDDFTAVVVDRLHHVV